MKKNQATVTLLSSDVDLLREIAKRENRCMAQQIRHWIKQYFQQKESA